MKHVCAIKQSVYSSLKDKNESQPQEVRHPNLFSLIGESFQKNANFLYLANHRVSNTSLCSLLDGLYSIEKEADDQELIALLKRPLIKEVMENTLIALE